MMKKCLVCLAEIPRSGIEGSMPKGKNNLTTKRGTKSVTCSKAHSKI
jgi:hypothetical protein